MARTIPNPVARGRVSPDDIRQPSLLTRCQIVNGSMIVRQQEDDLIRSAPELIDHTRRDLDPVARRPVGSRGISYWRNEDGTDNPGRVFEDLIIMSLPASTAGYDSAPVGAHVMMTLRAPVMTNSQTQQGRMSLAPRSSPFLAFTLMSWPTIG